jgi:hypothetical protein
MKVADARKRIDELCQDLYSLADAFGIVGNGAVARNLFAVTESIEFQVNIIKSAHDELVHEAFANAEQASANMLAAAIAGMNITKDK